MLQGWLEGSGAPSMVGELESWKVSVSGRGGVEGGARHPVQRTETIQYIRSFTTFYKLIAAQM